MKACSGRSSQLPSRISRKPRDSLLQRHIAPGDAGEALGHEEWLGEEALDLAGARHNQFIVFAQFVNTQDGNDVLQILIALQHTLDFTRGVVVFLAHDVRVKNAGGGRQRIHRRIDALFHNGAFEGNGRIQVGKGRHRRRV